MNIEPREYKTPPLYSHIRGFNVFERSIGFVEHMPSLAQNIIVPDYGAELNRSHREVENLGIGAD